MTDGLESFQAQLRRLSHAFALDLPERVEALAAILQDGPATEETLHAAHREIHKLAGGSGSFGFRAFGRVCRDLELRLQDGLEAGEDPEGLREAALGLVGPVREELGRLLASLADPA